MLKHILHVALALLIAFGGGVGSAWYAVHRPDPAPPAAAGWMPATPRDVDDDVYRLARLHRLSLPLGPSDGLAFVARRSDEGAALDRRCRYRIEGALPPARFWTLAAVDARLKPLAAPGGPAALHSQEVLQESGADLAVTASAKPAPGNWLPLPGAGGMAFVLSLYDTPAASGVGLTDMTLPGIKRLDCGA